MYLNLKTEMNRADVSIGDIAEILHIHRNSASAKVNGDTSFTIEEAFALRDAKFPYTSAEYLFKRYKSDS